VQCIMWDGPHNNVSRGRRHLMTSFAGYRVGVATGITQAENTFLRLLRHRPLVCETFIPSPPSRIFSREISPGYDDKRENIL